MEFDPEMTKRVPLLLVLLSLMSAAYSATYADMFDPKIHITISDHSAQITDVEVGASTCSKYEPFVCVRSSVFNFAVPRDGEKNEWDFEGEHYRVVGHDQGRIFGSLVKYRVIAVTGKSAFRVAYSDSRGLLAIQSSSGNVLVASEPCGIARLKPDKVCKP